MPTAPTPKRWTTRPWAATVPSDGSRTAPGDRVAGWAGREWLTHQRVPDGGRCGRDGARRDHRAGHPYRRRHELAAARSVSLVRRRPPRLRHPSRRPSPGGGGGRARARLEQSRVRAFAGTIRVRRRSGEHRVAARQRAREGASEGRHRAGEPRLAVRRTRHISRATHRRDRYRRNSSCWCRSPASLRSVCASPTRSRTSTGTVELVAAASRSSQEIASLSGRVRLRLLPPA